MSYTIDKLAGFTENRNYFILFGIVICSFVLYLVLQPSVDYYSTTPYDGKQYLKSAQYFTGEKAEYSVVYPFNSRIGVPYLSSLIPSLGIVTMFIVINSLCLVFFFLLLVRFLKDYGLSSFRVIAFVVLWLSFHFMGPIRYYFNDPLSIDLPAMVLEAVVVLMFLQKRAIFLILSAIASVFFKESVIPLLVILSFSSLLFFDRQLFIAIIISLISVVVIKWQLGVFFPMEIVNSEYKSYYTLYNNIKRVLLDPREILEWAVSLVFTGSLLLVKIKRLREVTPEQKTILLVALYGLGIAQVGGNDYTRLQFFSSIFVFTAIAMFLRKISYLELSCLALGSLPFLRVFTILPELNSYKTFPEYFDVLTCCLWLSYFLFVLVLYKVYDWGVFKKMFDKY
jgi:hypothetical protein